MAERAYTMKEIDAMRAAIARRVSHQMTVKYLPEDLDRQARAVEDQLRTAMTGNVAPEDLIASCPEIGGLRIA